MKNSDIIKATIEQMKNLEIPIYTRDTTEGYEKPCFFIEIEPDTITQHNHDMVEYAIQITLTYIDTRRDDVALSKLTETLRKLFIKRLKVGNRQLLISNFDYTNVGDNDELMEYTFTIRFYEEEAETDDNELMQEVFLKEN